MKRKAILIGASPQDDPLENVALDVATWQEFLKTNHGGGWDENCEIIDATEMNREDLLKLLQQTKDHDFSMVIFAGHGFSVKTDLPWPELNLILQTGETILEREINPGTPRCNIILDCCRAHGENVRPLEERVKKSSLERAYDEVRARILYDNALESAESGLVRIYATGDNAAAADKASFSQILIHSSMRWAGHNQGILSIKDAVAMAATEMESIRPQQIPEYNGGRRLRHFPFALGL